MTISGCTWQEADEDRLWTTIALNIGSIVVVFALSFNMRAQNRKLRAGNGHMNEGSHTFEYAI
jgi:hypothetical protein